MCPDSKCPLCRRELPNKADDFALRYDVWIQSIIVSDRKSLKMSCGQRDELKAIADEGYAPAQTSMGVMLASEHEFTEAYTYFNLAAAQGYRDAIFNKGVFMLEGKGVEPDLDAGKELLLSLVEGIQEPSFLNSKISMAIAVMYQDQLNEREEAEKWLTKVLDMDQGELSNEAHTRLGFLCSRHAEIYLKTSENYLKRSSYHFRVASGYSSVSKNIVSEEDFERKGQSRPACHS
jgi:TPR repeat protein